jgi:hypothetical protein
MTSTSWETLEKLFNELSDYNHPGMNVLAQSGGKKIDIDVTLVSEKEKLAVSGTVSMLPSEKFLDGTAVYMFREAVHANGIHALWDKAHSGAKKTPTDLGTFLAFDDLAHSMLGYDRNKSLRNNLMEVLRSYDRRRNHGGIPARRREAYNDIVSAIIADSVVIKSEDIEQILYERKPWMMRLKEFKPCGLVF